jgi:hypothetical protein
MKLVNVYMETLEGATYAFPDMDNEILEKVLNNEGTWRALGSLSLVNVSGACMVIPTRIIKTIALTPDFSSLVWTASAA